MALVLANRVQESATANTTVSFTLSGAVAGFQTFAVVGDTNTTYYSATDSSGNWEVGLGTYSTTGPTLTRTTIYASSNSGNAVTFSGAVNVFVTYPSGRSVNLDSSGNVSALGTVASGTWQGSTVGVAYGGTGVTASSGANSVVLRDANQNITVNRVNQSNTNTTAAGGTTTLTTASSYIQSLVGTGGQTYALPDATALTTGVAFIFNNLATGTLTITDYAAATIGTIPAGGAGAVFLTNNATTGGTWDLHAYLPEGVTFGTNALALGSTVISGGTWQGGTIQPAYGGTGLTTFTGANNALYSTGATTLTAGTLPVAAGGTGATTLTGYVKGNGTGAMTASASIPNSDTTATSANTANAIVARDASGDFSAGTITANLTGTASSATSATTATNLAGGVAGAVPYQSGVGATGFSAAGSSGQVLTSAGTGAPTWTTATDANTASAIVQRDASGNFSAGTITATLSGNATNVSGTVAVANGGTGLTSGTSGGVLYYSATGTLASSAALAANSLVKGGGAGVAPSTITTGTDVLTALGVNVGSAGAFVVNGGALGTPSSGTVTNLTGTASISINGTVGATTPNTGAFTSVTSTSASGILTRAAATQDGVELVGRAGGTTSLKVTLTPATLTASRTLTLPDNSGTVLTTGATVAVSNGGTGQTTYTDGQLLIGNTTGNTLTKATLTGTSNQITVTNGNGSITLSTPQSINTTASVQFGSFGVGTAASGTTGEIRATNNVTAYYSDERLKTRLGKIENALDKLCSLEGFYYEANETAQALGYEVKREVGVSAQQVQAVMPEIVAPAPIDAKYMTVRYERALPLLIEAIKELREEVRALKG